MGKEFPTFAEGQYIVDTINSSSHKADLKIPKSLLIYNSYKNRLSFETLHSDLAGPDMSTDRVESCFEIDGTDTIATYSYYSAIF